ncbi:MAG TPA: hypothetical protein VFO11_02365 [Candidatus Polarisedimenticolaceae bacterium]|nr:hypothetical protein [Candidatus Polarisedimenticolaceae bacterium]
MKAPLGLALLLCALPARAGTWAHDFGGPNADHPHTILETSDGGFLVAGDASFDAHFSQPCPCQYWHFWLTRIDASGYRLWDALYQEGGYAYLSGAAARPEGGWMLAGRRTVPTTTLYVQHPFLLATDASGALLDAREVGAESDSLRSIVSTTDGRFVTVGTTSTSNVSETWLMKVAAAGDIVWSHRYGTRSSDVPGPRRLETGIAAAPTADGGVLVGEVVNNSNPRKPLMYAETDIAIDRIDADGQVLWSRTYGGSGIEEVVDLEQTADGGILVLGSRQPRDAVAKAAWVLSLDASGNILWQETLTTATAGTAGVALVSLPDGTAAALLGLDRGYPFRQGTALVRLGRLGEILWARTSLDLSPFSALTRASNGDFVLGLSAAENMRVLRVLDDAPEIDCSGLVQDLGFVRTATAEASTARKVSRHVYAPVVSTPPVVVQVPVGDLGAACP